MPEPTRKKDGKPDETDVLIALLREYTGKLNTIVGHRANPDKINQIHDKTSKLLLAGLRPAAMQLARYTSQQIEHGDSDPLVQLELRLRLAEFEAALKAADIE